MAKVVIKAAGGLSNIARSDGIAEQLEVLGRLVLQRAKSDPNEEYRATLRMRRFYTRGRSGRVSVQVGAAPIIGSRVEAKRGTLARALGVVG